VPGRHAGARSAAGTDARVLGKHERQPGHAGRGSRAGPGSARRARCTQRHANLDQLSPWSVFRCLRQLLLRLRLSPTLSRSCGDACQCRSNIGPLSPGRKSTRLRLVDLQSSARKPNIGVGGRSTGTATRLARGLSSVLRRRQRLSPGSPLTRAGSRLGPRATHQSNGRGRLTVCPSTSASGTAPGAPR
jgi:hypothetical protein